MNLQLATINDYKKIKEHYSQVVKNMCDNNIDLWNSDYPICTLEKDINNEQLYILTLDNDIIGSFVLNPFSNSKDNVVWKNNNSTALYLERFCINPKYKNKGYGSTLLKYAEELSNKQNALYLRFFVVDFNYPAISFYEKHNYKKANGINYDSQVKGHIFKEYGYEKKIK